MRKILSILIAGLAISLALFGEGISVSAAHNYETDTYILPNTGSNPYEANLYNSGYYTITDSNYPHGEPAGIIRVEDTTTGQYFFAYCDNDEQFLNINQPRVINYLWNLIPSQLTTPSQYWQQIHQEYETQMYILSVYGLSSNYETETGSAEVQAAIWISFDGLSLTGNSGVISNADSLYNKAVNEVKNLNWNYSSGSSASPEMLEVQASGSQPLVLLNSAPPPKKNPTPTPTPLPTPSPPPNPSLPAFPTFTKGVVMSNPPSVFYAFVPVCSWIEQGNVPAGSQSLPFNAYPVITSQNLDEYQFVYNLSFQAYSSASGTAGDLTWSFDNGQSGISGPGTPTAALPTSPAIPSNVPVPNSCINYHVYKVVTPPNSQGVVNSASTQILWSGTLTRCYIGTGTVCIVPASTVWSQPLTPDGPVINMAEAPVPVEQIESVPYS